MKYFNVLLGILSIMALDVYAKGSETPLDSLPDPIVSLRTGNRYFYTGGWHHNGGYSRSGTFADEIVGDTIINALKYAVIKRSTSLYSIYGPDNLGDIHNNLVFDKMIYHYRRVNDHFLYEYYSSSNLEFPLMDFDANVGTDDLGFGYVGIRATASMFGEMCLNIQTNLSHGSFYLIEKYSTRFGWLGFSIDGGGVSGTIGLIGAVVDGKAYGDTSSSLTSVSHPESEPSEGFHLDQNYPNPFNATTEIRYQVSGVSNLKLAVYDILGREVAVLVNEKKEPGRYEVTFDGSNLASGVYLCRIQAGDFVATRRVLLLK